MEDASLQEKPRRGRKSNNRKIAITPTGYVNKRAFKKALKICQEPIFKAKKARKVKHDKIEDLLKTDPDKVSWGSFTYTLLEVNNCIMWRDWSTAVKLLLQMMGAHKNYHKHILQMAEKLFRHDPVAQEYGLYDEFKTLCFGASKLSDTIM